MMATCVARAALVRACCRRSGSAPPSALLHARATLVRRGAPTAVRALACGVSARAASATRGGAQHPWQRVSGALQGAGTRGYASAALPDHVVVAMPALSPTMTQGTIVSWSVSVG